LVEGSVPGARSDDYRVALAVEGGGMRGVVSSGMLLALEQVGYRDGFDLVIGTSAGALAASFFVMERATEGSVLFYTELNNAPFLDKRNALKRRKAIDLDYLVDRAAPERGLDYQLLERSGIELWATVAAAEDGNPIKRLRLEGDDDRMNAILKASAALPVLGGASRYVDGESYVDGGLSEQIPWRSAMDLGATHLLVLPSRPVGEVEEASKMTFIEKFATTKIVGSLHGQRVAELVGQLPEAATNQALSLLAVAAGSASPLLSDGGSWTGHLELVDIPEIVRIPSRLETKRVTLLDGLVGGARTMLEHFGIDNSITVEQRVVLHHPDVQVQEFRSEQLTQVVANSLWAD
jgi:predicted patatin/cPLA2 family phospholipase